MCFTPSKNDYAKILQALSRGSRDCNIPCFGGLIVDWVKWAGNHSVQLKYSTIIDGMRQDFVEGNLNIRNKVKFAHMHHNSLLEGVD